MNERAQITRRSTLAVFLLFLIICYCIPPVTALRGNGGGQSANRRCNGPSAEICGEGEGVFVCEYNEERDFYASRCVRKDVAIKHVQQHVNNYCGTCQMCYQDGELGMAVAGRCDGDAQR